MMPAYRADRPPLTRRQQSDPWGDDGPGAVGRLVERVDQQEQAITQQQRTIRQLRAALEGEQHRNALLRSRLAMKRTRRRHRPDPAQLSLPLVRFEEVAT